MRDGVYFVTILVLSQIRLLERFQEMCGVPRAQILGVEPMFQRDTSVRPARKELS